MPGRPITDQQMRYYMTLRTRHTRDTAAAMAGLSTSTGYRVERDPRLPSRKKACHGQGGGRPDPLTEIWDSEIVPMLERTPGLRPITIFEEMVRRHPSGVSVQPGGHSSAAFGSGRPGSDRSRK